MFSRLNSCCIPTLIYAWLVSMNARKMHGFHFERHGRFCCSAKGATTDFTTAGFPSIVSLEVFLERSTIRLSATKARSSDRKIGEGLTACAHVLQIACRGTVAVAARVSLLPDFASNPTNGLPPSQCRFSRKPSFEQQSTCRHEQDTGVE